jgi:hypothetical protein
VQSSGLGGLHTKPGEQPQSESLAVDCGVMTLPGALVGIGHVTSSFIVTVVSPPVNVKVDAGRDSRIVVVITTPG